MNLYRKIEQNLFSIFQTGLVALLVVMIVVFVILMWSKEPLWIFELLGLAEREETKHEALKFVGIGMGGVLVALQALMSYKRAKAMEETANTQASAVLKTEEGQRQERMKIAIEHLGHRSDSVRLGGAYELFHLAEDTGALRQTVLDILCAHIRQTTGQREYRKRYESKPSEEIQSILTLLFVQEHDVFEGLRINLRESWLKGAELRKSRLENAILSGANLQNADLIGAHLDKAILARAQLQRAILQGAHLREAKLHSVSFHKANFNGVRLQGAYLIDARLEGVNLSGAHLGAAVLDGAFLKGANLSRACLQEAYLCSAHLQGANLAGARLHGASLNTAHLQGANLARAQLHGAHLVMAELHGVRCQDCFPDAFTERVSQAIGKESDLSTVIFGGGLTQVDVERPLDGVIDATTADVLREKLIPHIGRPVSHELPEDSGVITEPYTAEEAAQWIAEYEEVMSEVPEDDS